MYMYIQYMFLCFSVVCLSVCLCPLLYRYLKKHMPNYHEIFCTIMLPIAVARLSLLMMLQYVMYFRYS